MMIGGAYSLVQKHTRSTERPPVVAMDSKVVIIGLQ
jgi:hypothetical protein